MQPVPPDCKNCRYRDRQAAKIPAVAYVIVTVFSLPESQLFLCMVSLVAQRSLLLANQPLPLTAQPPGLNPASSV